MDHRSRMYLATAATVGIFLLVQLGALALVQPFDTAGYQAVENPEDPTNSVVYIAAILVATGVMLLAFKLDLTWIIRGLIVFSSALVSLYVFTILIPPVVTVSIGGAPTHILPVVAAGLLAVLLLAYPEWYVIDAVGIVMGAGAAGLFGISFGLLPAIVLLTALAVYDAISVYGTEHMLTLAEGVMDIKVPVILIVPLSLSYSFLAEGSDDDATEDDDAEPTEADDDGERDAFFIGLGDAVMPTVMVASAAVFAPAPMFDVGALTMNLPALTALIGTMLGLLVLMFMVMKGKPHAGLPLLNGGAIGGYLLGALVSGISLVQAVGLASYL
ncbi:presenilin family intramembrane aspartyl protease PSH [Haladaptatus sp. GCM10025707]|uniref:presenilin family intramembrane aspartyl protease PSH n=1 Tax=unclassified Haladaptatus TaxID=2622732 RepID=UPI0023E8E252|nr:MULTISPECIES: presenilin family intramembrane aspartyl protease PSH [unclassified Haladaptatus]